MCRSFWPEATVSATGADPWQLLADDDAGEAEAVGRMPGRNDAGRSGRLDGRGPGDAEFG